MKLKSAYYQTPDPVLLARDLLGKVLYTAIENEITAGIIVETEAYFGTKDKASHAYGGRRTKRTETLYLEGGVAYVYLCYGLHHLFNIVSSIEGEPHAVLVRAVEPLLGRNIMELRRNTSIENPSVTAGPGSAAKALGIDRSFDGKSLQGDELWIEDHGIRHPEGLIAAVPRVGVAYAQEDALLPWRFFVRGNKYVSKPNKG